MITLTAQQIAFYNTNGYLELEDFFTNEECFEYDLAIQKEIKKTSRDLWRNSNPLKKLILSRNLSHLVLSLTHQPSVRLGCDHLFSSEFSLKKAEKMKNLFSLQGVICAMIFQFQTGHCKIPAKTSPLGFLPFPQKKGNIVIV